MKVLLLQPDNEKKILVGSYSVDPLGLEYISSVLIEAGHDVKILLSTNVIDIEFVNELINFNPNIVGFSVFTFSLERSLQLAEQTKRFSASIITVFGGYHPTACPEVVKSEFVDFVISGEGEQSLKDLIDYICGRLKLEDISGVFYWQNGMRGRKTEKRVDFKSLPFPRRSIELLRNNKVRQVVYPSISNQRSVAQITYSRGCPYNCSFCNSQLMFPGNVIWRDPHHVVKEINELIHDFGTNLIFFSDLTFNASKNRVHQLCNEIIKNKLPISWCALCRIDNIDRDLLLHMREAGCTKVSYGIETVSNHVHIDVKQNYYVEKTEALEVIEMTSDIGLLVRGLFILGLPGENWESITELTSFILESELDDIRISFFVPFPGTKLYDDCRKEGCILSESFSDFTTDKPIVKLDSHIHQELPRIRQEIVKTFYESKEYRNHFLRKIGRYPFLQESYIEYFYLLRKQNLISIEGFDNITLLNRINDVSTASY